MKTSRTTIIKAITCLLETGARQCVVYQHPELSVKVTRRFKPSKRDKSVNLVLTIGKPDFSGRKFVKDCIKAGVKFPVRKPQLKFFK